ncbi:MAG TPA: GvpL/GvpF family gas vesicle protein [Gemmatimonadaceae bacterium]|nr:GvpL/GvpF family gas vesicle protein [Gemmatimonadaceae bacterium]
MSTHLYCVVPHQLRGAGAIPPGLSGVGGGRVRELPVDGLVAWVSDIERDVPIWGTGVRETGEGLREHDAVVEAALETGTTPVPARFGQRFDDDDACRAALVRRASSVESLVTTMQGFVEMTIIITPSTRRMLRDLEPVIPEMLEPQTRGNSPRYLDKLRATENASGAVSHATDGLADQIRLATVSVVRRSTVHQSVTPMPLRTISHLVARDDITAYKRAVRTVQSAGEFRFLVIGPRAPYSFCGLTDDSGGTHGMNLAD